MDRVSSRYYGTGIFFNSLAVNEREDAMQDVVSRTSGTTAFEVKQ